MRGRTAARVLLVGGCLAVLFGPSGAPAEADDKDAADARAVYCLARDHRAGLADAAVSLRLATASPRPGHVVADGADLDLDAWRAKHAKSFERACRAFYTASKEPAAAPGGPGGGLGLMALVAVLLPVAAGAALTLLTTEWRAARDAGRLRADALRSAARAFAEAATGYAQAWTEHSIGPQPPDREVARARAELDARLRETEVLRRRWTAVPALRAAMASGPLGAALAEGWRDLGPDERRTRAEGVRDAADDLGAACGRTARALERPGRRHGAMRT
ncbi:hypothetical protein AGRA3207_007064 [Actinomadura graeca]|uniref:Uncharacterized protein n=1 Tax=Actinomadura graeca TaxID=2750812 RepID=A0ABX8R994_9ACTN|nr:hypothetical protein [Actinomadura graeca]QXJ25553.1 hypothetical protein AGRA3207_007064 [Actinomadura graeca]